MFKKLKNVFAPTTAEDEQVAALDGLQISVAVLLTEIAKADHEHADVETDEIRKQLAAHFSLSETDAAELAETARATAAESVSLHDFTKTLHARMSYREKEAVVEMLWRIALADLNLDKYEDYMIGKIAELMYVYRADVMRIKHGVSEALRNSL